MNGARLGSDAHRIQYQQVCAPADSSQQGNTLRASVEKLDGVAPAGLFRKFREKSKAHTVVPQERITKPQDENGCEHRCIN